MLFIAGYEWSFTTDALNVGSKVLGGARHSRIVAGINVYGTSASRPHDTEIPFVIFRLDVSGLAYS
jgi:hypothetical protein